MMKPVFVIVDDDDESRATLVELCQNQWPTCDFRDFESLHEAAQLSRIDLLLVDTSAMSAGHWSFMSSGLAAFIERHPGAEIFIQSAMSRNAIRDLIEDLQRDYSIDTSFIFSAGFQWDSIKESVKANCKTLTGPQLGSLIE